MINEYKENQKKIKTISDNIDKLQEKKGKEIYNLKYKIYDEKIKVLQDERDKKIDKLEDEFEKIENKKKEEIENLSIHINKVKRIIEFIEINKKEIRNLNFKAYSYYGFPKEKNYLKPLDIIYNDEFIYV